DHHFLMFFSIINHFHDCFGFILYFYVFIFYGEVIALNKTSNKVKEENKAECFVVRAEFHFALMGQRHLNSTWLRTQR
ncbi:hypothetical protein, partial [Klebsiella pneumoniae]|uniref:hypothetical protein n=1 Tax=Klebsiella pneumoniae TaxID=573 RepID=UPI00358E7C12